MARTCPNINSTDWKNLVAKHGEEQALKIFAQNGYRVPTTIKKDANPKLFGNKYLFNGQAVQQTLEKDPKLAQKLMVKLKEAYPDMNINPDRLFDADGNWVELQPGTKGMHVRNAFNSAIAFSNEALIETIPHEFAHEYIQMFRSHPIVREALSKYSEEKLATELGKYYAGKENASWFIKFLDDLMYIVRSLFSIPDVSEELARHFYKNKQLSKKQAGEGYVSFQKMEEQKKQNYEKNYNARLNGSGFNPGNDFQRVDISQLFMPESFIFERYVEEILPDFENKDGQFDHQEFYNHLKVHIEAAIDHKLELNKGSRVDVTDYNHAELDSNLLKDFRNFIENENKTPNTENLTFLKDYLKDPDSFTLTEEQQAYVNIFKRMHQSIGIAINGEFVIPGYQSTISDNIFTEQNKLVEKDQVVSKVREDFDKKINTRDTFFQKVKDKIPKQLSFLKKLDLSKISPWLYDGYLLAKSLTKKTDSVFRKLFYNSLDHATNEFYEIQNNFQELLTIPGRIKNYENWGTADVANKKIEDYETIEIELRDGSKTKLTKSEATTLFLNLSQNDTAEAIDKYGFYLNDHIKGRNIPYAKPVRISERSKSQIIREFTTNEDYKAVVESVRRGMDYLWNRVNPTFKQLNGYDLEQKENYFPAYYGKAPLDERKQKKVIEQFRSAHARLGGKMPPRIGDVKGILNNYAVASGMYAAYTIPIRNNRIVLESIRADYKGTIIEDRLGMVDGFLNKLEDPTLLYSSQGERRITQLINENMSNFSIFVLGYNQFVVLKQTASYMAAKEHVPTKHLKEAGLGVGGVIIPKLSPFFKSLKKVNKDQDLDTIRKLLPIEYRMDEENESYKEIKKYSPYLTHRFEGHVNRELSEALMNRSKGKDIVELKVPGFKKPLRFSKTRAMEGIRVMDAITVMGVWKATKLWTDEQINNGELDIQKDSKEYWEHIATTAEFAIKRTQPVSDIINRSFASSEKAPIPRTLTMFSSATQQMGKLMLDRVMDFNNNPNAANRKKMFMTMANVMVLTSLYVTAIDMIKVSLMHGFEDDEDMVSFSTHSVVNNMAGYFHGFGTLVRIVSSRIDNQPWTATLQHPVETLVEDMGDVMANMLTLDVGKGAKKSLDVLFKIKGVPGFPLKTGEQLYGRYVE